jgi:hypothetical protein
MGALRFIMRNNKQFTVKSQYDVCRVLLKEILWKQNFGMNTRVIIPPTGVISLFLLTIYCSCSICSYIWLMD